MHISFVFCIDPIPPYKKTLFPTILIVVCSLEFGFQVESIF